MLLFALATVAIPTLQSVLVSGAENLPFGLASLHGLVFVVTIIAGLALLFGCLCIIYWAVPKGSIPWRAVWPGAIRSDARDHDRRLRLPALSEQCLDRSREIGTTLVFIAIVLLWFYVLAIILLSGAVINALPARSRCPSASQPRIVRCEKPLRGKHYWTHLTQKEAFRCPRTRPVTPSWFSI